MKQRDISDWLAKGLERTETSQTELALGIGLSPDKINNIIHGRRKMSGDEVARAAEYMRIPPPSENASLSVLGYIGAGAAIFPINDGDPLHEVDLDIPIPRGSVGAIVRGDSMLPIFEDGDLIAYSGETMTPEMALGQTCIVQLADGRMLIKTIRRGSRSGLFTLTSSNAPDIEDVAIEWARKFVMRYSREYWRRRH